MRKTTATKAQTKEEAPGWRRPGYPPAKEAPAPADNLPAVAAPNPWSQYGASASSVVHEFLKFSKGEYLAGRDGAEIAIGTHMVVNMDSLEVGWIKWVDDSPADRRLGRLAEGFKPCKRSELDDADEESWPVGINDKPEDPWRFTNNIVMALATDGALFTFTTSSRGGLNAIGLLCKAYGEACKQHSGEWPVVELGVGSYQHSNRAYGRIKFPTLAIVAWAPKDAKTVAAA